MGETGTVSFFPLALLAFLRHDSPLPIDCGVTTISINSNAYNSAKQISFMGFPVLTSITIGDNSYKIVDSVTFKDLPVLKSITIGTSSFYPYHQLEWPADETPSMKGELHISNCPQLESLIIGRFSFGFFTSFIIYGSPLHTSYYE